MPVNCIMLSYMAPAVNDKPPAAPSRLTLVDHDVKSSMAVSSSTAYHRFSRPPSIAFNNVQDGHLAHQREGFGALPVPAVRRGMVKEDSANSIASSVDVLPATHGDKRPANKPVTLKRSVPGHTGVDNHFIKTFRK